MSEKCICSMICSVPEGLEHADLNVKCCELPYRIYSPSVPGLMNQVKSTHHTIDHFRSVKYAEFVDPMEENGNSEYSCTYCCCFIPQIHFLNCDTT
jgi:hypothetical protein